MQQKKKKKTTKKNTKKNEDVTKKQTLNTSSSFQKEQFAAFKGSEQRQEKTYFQVVEKIEEEDLQKQQDSFLQLAQLFSQ